VIATATDRRPIAGALLLSAVLLLGGCSRIEQPDTEQLSSDDCLNEMTVDDLKQALRHCDQVVAAFPDEPRPLSERFLLHNLNGDQASACRDIERAAVLAARLPAVKLDPLLRSDLKLRQADCRT
jgi:hypothetical protein